MKVSKKFLLAIAVFFFVSVWAFADSSSSSSDESIYSVGDFLKLLGSLGLFLFGMKYMSEGIQKAAGSKLRQVLRTLTSNRFVAVVTGFLVTTIVQSSSATTVMVVSFTNAGLFTLTESIGVIMGANIGTTVTGWIVAMFGLKVSVAKLALPIMGITFPFMFFGNDRVKNWAEFIIGFALLFFGLGLLKESVPDIKSNPEILEFIQGWSGLGFGSLIIFILVGTVLTIVVQSSSASMALTIVLLSKGWIDFPTAAAMVLGENIGTTITAQLASLMANLNARRAAMAHTLFNLAGVLWMLILFRPFLTFSNWVVTKSLGAYCNVFSLGCGISPDQVDLLNASAATSDLAPIGLAVFHTSFNIINTLLLVWFVPQFVKAVTYLLSKGAESIEALKFLDYGMMATPELAVVEAQNELTEFGKLTKKMYATNLAILYKDNAKKTKKGIKKISKFEEECDEKEKELARYLAALSMHNLSKNTASKIRRIWSIINDLERIGDLNEKIMLHLAQREEQIEINEESLESLKAMTIRVDKAYEMLLEALDKEVATKFTKEDVSKLEMEINEIRDNLKNSFFIEIENSTISFQTGLALVEIVSNLEKIADHIYAINNEMLEMS
ncbi:MAG: Na/Pi cotransporter family protein [Bacteroidia bacterium]